MFERYRAIKPINHQRFTFYQLHYHIISHNNIHTHKHIVMKIHRVAVLVLGTWPASTMAGFASPRPHDVARRSRRGFAALSAHRGGEPTERTHHAHHADPITATSSGYAPKSRGRPWRSVISRVLPYRRNANSGEGGGSGSSSSSVMQMKRLQDESYVMAHPMNDTTSFILRSFQESSPLDVFGNIDLSESAQQDNDFASLMNRNSQKKRPTIDSSSSPSPSTDLSSLASSLSQSTIASTMENIVVGVESTSKNKSYEGGSPLTRVARLWFQNVLHGLLCRWAVEQPEALQVRVAPSGNVLGRLLTKGQLRLNAEIHFDRLVFPNICLSGGSIAAKRMTLNVWSFAPNMVRFSIPRYDSQFEISATNCTLTQADLLKSSCIRNGLRNLLIRVLKGRGIQPSHVVVNSLDILVRVHESLLHRTTPSLVQAN